MAFTLNPFSGRLDATGMTASEQAAYLKKVIAGTVETAAATAAKEVTIAGYTPTAGDVLAITYTLGDTSSATTTLSINGSAPISIRLGATAASTTTHSVTAGGTVMYYYDGTRLQLFGSMRTSDSDTIQAVYHNVNKVAGVDITRYKIVMEGSDNKFYPLSVGDTTALTKVQSAMTFKPLGLILWYGTTPTVDADATFTYTFTEHTFSTATYTFNKTSSYTNYAPIFIVGTIDANGFFVLDQTDATSWFTQTLPSTEDGKVYIRIGLLYNTTGAIHLETNHPIYQYKDGALRQYSPDAGTYLKLDQTIPQTVVNGMPSFDGGLKVKGTTLSYLINLSPVTYNSVNYYITDDASVIFYLSTTEDTQIVVDDGTQNPISIAGLSDSQPTIYMYLVNVFDGTAQVTCYSDLNEADFLTFIRALAEDETAVIDYHETAFTFADGVYTNVTTKPVCPDSTATDWTNPSVIIIDYLGFKVNPTTTNIEHVGNYTNNITTSVFKSKGQLKLGNGTLADIITCPIVSNPLFNQDYGGGLQFAMAFTPQIERAGGTVLSPVSAALYAAGMYGTTLVGGSNTRFSGEAIGGWCAVQNTSLGNVELTKGVAMKAGMTYSSEDNLVIRDFICYQTNFTNLNNGTSTHDTIKMFDSPEITTQGDIRIATSKLIYGLYLADNSGAIIAGENNRSWGLYSLETNNYAKKLYVGATPTTPTEDFEVEANVKAAGYKSGTEVGQTTTVTVVTDVRDNAGQMEKKTQVLTFTSGLLTTKADESAWTATTDI